MMAYKSQCGPVVGHISVFENGEVREGKHQGAAHLELRVWLMKCNSSKLEYLLYFSDKPPFWWSMRHKAACEEYVLNRKLSEETKGIELEGKRYVSRK